MKNGGVRSSTFTSLSRFPTGDTSSVCGGTVTSSTTDRLISTSMYRVSSPVGGTSPGSSICPERPREVDSQKLLFGPTGISSTGAGSLSSPSTKVITSVSHKDTPYIDTSGRTIVLRVVSSSTVITTPVSFHLLISSSRRDHSLVMGGWSLVSVRHMSESTSSVTPSPHLTSIGALLVCGITSRLSRAVSVSLHPSSRHTTSTVSFTRKKDFRLGGCRIRVTVYSPSTVISCLTSPSLCTPIPLNLISDTVTTTLTRGFRNRIFTDSYGTFCRKGRGPIVTQGSSV